MRRIQSILRSLPIRRQVLGWSMLGEPPVGSGCASIVNALSDALGDDLFRRAPVMLDAILTSLEAGHPVTEPLTAHI